jgi:hypothetical protein
MARGFWPLAWYRTTIGGVGRRNPKFGNANHGSGKTKFRKERPAVMPFWAVLSKFRFRPIVLQPKVTLLHLKSQP